MIRLGSVKTQQFFDKSSIQASSNLQLCPLIPEHKVFACLPWIGKVGHGGQLDMVETLMAIAWMIMANGDHQGDDLQLGAPGGGRSCAGRRAGRCHLLPQSNLLEAGSPGFKGNNVMINLCRAWVHHGIKTTLTLDSLMEDVAPPCGRSIFPLVECALCMQ